MLLILENEYLSKPVQVKQYQKYTHSIAKHI